MASKIFEAKSVKLAEYIGRKIAAKELPVSQREVYIYARDILDADQFFKGAAELIDWATSIAATLSLVPVQDGWDLPTFAEPVSPKSADIQGTEISIPIPYKEPTRIPGIPPLNIHRNNGKCLRIHAQDGSVNDPKDPRWIQNRNR